MGDAKDIQYRQFSELETRTDGDAPGFSGYASTWWNVDSYGTAMSPKAFAKTIRERGDRLPVLSQHNPDKPIGRHLSIKEDKVGLAVNVELVDDGADGTVTLKRLRGGIPLAMSFGFQTVKDRSAEDADPIDLSQLPGFRRNDVRIITEVKLWETSVVTFPANEAAVITAVRHRFEADALTTLLESIEADTLTDEQFGHLERFMAAANQHRAGAGLPTPLVDVTARRNTDIRIALTLAKAKGYLGAA